LEFVWFSFLTRRSNVTFVQLGLKDLGERLLALPAATVAQQMALLALITCLVALSFGWWMQRQGWSTRLLLKLQLALGVVGNWLAARAGREFAPGRAADPLWYASLQPATVTGRRSGYV
jgi:hypothetical protein